MRCYLKSLLSIFLGDLEPGFKLHDQINSFHFAAYIQDLEKKSQNKRKKKFGRKLKSIYFKENITKIKEDIEKKIRQAQIRG